MRRVVSSAVIIFLGIAILLTGAWATLALWYRVPGPGLLRGLAACLFAAIGLLTILTLFSRWRFKVAAGYTFAFVLVVVWWSTIVPVANADWSPDVARQVTGTIDGNMLMLTDVRDFEWRSDTDFTERWTNRTYDLSRLTGVDFLMSYWSGTTIAHVILSFGFEGGEQLAWSIEVRRRAGGAFSPLADLFKSNPLVIIAADERDVVGVRSNIRGEDVQIYRLRASPQAARMLLHEYVADANALAKTPEFYNSITTNCTTTVVKMMRAVGDAVPLDWRLIINGYLPDYAYERGAVDTSIPLSKLRAAAHIEERARKEGLSADFSRAIRIGVPTPIHKSSP